MWRIMRPTMLWMSWVPIPVPWTRPRLRGPGRRWGRPAGAPPTARIETPPRMAAHDRRNEAAERPARRRPPFSSAGGGGWGGGGGGVKFSMGRIGRHRERRVKGAQIFFRRPLARARAQYRHAAARPAHRATGKGAKAVAVIPGTRRRQVLAPAAAPVVLPVTARMRKAGSYDSDRSADRGPPRARSKAGRDSPRGTGRTEARPPALASAMTAWMARRTRRSTTAMVWRIGFRLLDTGKPSPPRGAPTRTATRRWADAQPIAAVNRKRVENGDGRRKADVRLLRVYGVGAQRRETGACRP